MAWIAVAIGGSAIAGLAGAYMNGNAARDAANTQAGAAREASGVQKYVFDTTNAQQEPWRQAGKQALGQMANPDFQRDFTMNDFQADPGYAFRMQEGQKALERSAAARGGLMSGGTMKALTQYGQDAASQEYQNAYNRFNNDRNTRYNRLASLAGIGQTANAQVGAAGQNYGNQVGQNLMGAANAQAAGQVSTANGYGNALNQGMNSWMQYSMMNKYLGE